MNTQERKLLCDGDDLYSLHHQLNSLASEFVEKHFKDLYKRSYGNPNYEGQLEKKVVMEEMDKWVKSAFNVMLVNTEGHGLTSFAPVDNIDHDLVASIEETKKQMEGDLEKLIKKRKQVAENMDQFTQLSNAYEASFLERIEFVEEKEEEEEETALPPLPSLKRPLEQVKKDYKESYESLGQLCKELESERSRLEAYQSLAKKLKD